LGIPSGSIRHHFSSKDNEGNIVDEAMYFKSETQSHLITLENKKTNSPQIQEIMDEKTSKNLVKHEKKDDKEAVFTPRHQILPKK